MNGLWAQVIELGVPAETILLIMFLPVVSTTVGIARHILGLKTLSIYAPIVLTYAFIELGFENGQIDYFAGLRHGLIIFAIVFVTATAFYSITRSLRMHYYPKMSLIFTTVSIIMVIVLLIGAYLGRTDFIKLNVFSIVLITAISERLISIYAKTDFKNTTYISAETLILTLINFSLLAWEPFRLFLMDSPWFLIALVILNFYVGQFRGLRLREYWRFRRILNRDYESEENGTS